MNKVILYLRFSDTKQIGGTSIEMQEQICRSACLTEGFEIVEIVKNEAVSASKTNPQRVLELLEFCKQKRKTFNILMVYKLDRFARCQEQHHWLRGKLLSMDIILRSATERIDESPSGKLVEGVLAAVNEYDNEMKREKVKYAMWLRVEQGLWPWNAPSGYMVDRNPNVKLSPHVPDKTCSEAYIQIFTKFATGLVSMADLVREYSKRKIYNYKGKLLKFTIQNVYKTLNSPYYCGMLKDQDGKLIIGQHKGIISLAIYHKCQTVQANRAKNINAKRMYNNPDFPLRRFVFCKECEKPLTGAWSTSESGGKHAYYYCLNKTCSHYAKMLKKIDMESQFLEYLKQVKPTEDFIKRFKERFIKKYENRKLEIKGDYIKQLSQIQNMEAEENRILDMAKKGIIPEHLVKRQIEDIENNLTLAKMEITEMHGEELDVTALILYAENFIRTVEISWLDAPLDIKQRLQRAIFPEGVIYEYPNYSNSKISPVFEVINTLATENTKNVTPGRVGLPLSG